MIDLAFRLGWRSTTRRGARWRTAGLFAIGAIVTTCMSLVAVAGTVKMREADRLAAVEDQAAAGGEAVGVQQRYEGREVRLVMVAAGSTDLPGLDEPLGVDEVRFSPALSRLVAEERPLAEWFPYRHGPVLPQDAVGSAGELKAYIGDRAEDVAAAPLDTPRTTTNYEARFTVYQQLGWILFVAAPAFTLVVLAGRIGRPTRRQRYASLRLLGASPLLCRATSAAEVALPMTAGAVVATVALANLPPADLIVPIVERSVFATDAQLSPLALFGVLALVAVASATAGAAVGRQYATGRLRDAVARLDATRPWAAALYVGGVLLALWAAKDAVPKDPRRLIATVAIVFGLPSAVAVTSRWIARLVGRPGAPLVALIATRKLAADARTWTRVAGMVSVTLFAVSVARPMIDVLTEPAVNSPSGAKSASRSTSIAIAESLRGLASIGPVGPPPPSVRTSTIVAGVWSSEASTGASPSTTGLLATCAELGELFDATVSSCDGSVQYLSASSDDPPQANLVQGIEMRSDSGESLVNLPPPTTVAVINTEDPLDLLSGRLLVPPALIPARSDPFAVAAIVRIGPDQNAFNDAQAWIISASPHHVLRTSNDVDSNAGTGRWMLLGVIFASAIATLGAAIASFDEQADVSQWASLRAVGLGLGSLSVIRTLIGVIGAAVSTSLALAAALLLGLSWLQVFDGQSIESYWPYVRNAFLACSLILVASVLATGALVARLSRPS